jgi:hypothetical protein
MTKQNFNKKYQDYIEKGRVGFTFDSPECADTLDKILGSILNTNSNFILGNIEADARGEVTFHSNLTPKSNEIISSTLSYRLKRELS